MSPNDLLHTPQASSTNNSTLFDVEEVKRALAVFHPDGQVFELRILEGDKVSDNWKCNFAGFFDNGVDAANSLGQLRSATGCYFTMNPVTPELLARSCNRIKKAGKGDSTGDGQIVSRKWLLVDIDPKRLSGISSTDEEHNAAIEMAREVWRHLKNEGWPDPVLCDSGNGAHLLFRIDLPADDGDLIKQCLFALDQRFSNEQIDIDTSVHNPSRIVRLYGTKACKGDSTKDRPHRLSRIIEAPDLIEVVTEEQLQTLASEVEEKPTKPSISHTNGTAYDVQGFIDRNGLDVNGPHKWNGNDKRWIFKTSPMCEHHDDGPHVVQFASGAISAGCHHNSCNWDWQELRARFEPRKNYELASTDSYNQNQGNLPTLPYKPFPVDTLPQTVRELVEAGARSFCCDPSMIALPVLSVLSAGIGDTRVIKLKDNWMSKSIIWSIVIARSGAAKSPAFSLAIEPLERLQDAAFKTYEDELTIYQKQEKIYNKEFKVWERGKTDGNHPRNQFALNQLDTLSQMLLPKDWLESSCTISEGCY